MTLSLVCLPFAGSGAGFYRAWKKLEVAGVDVVPLQLPGREERFIDPPHSDVATAALELAADAMRLTKDKEHVALFGHSLGAVLAFETARALLAQGHPTLRALFVSGSPGPWTGRTHRATGLDDDAFLARVNEFAGYRHAAFDDPDMRELLLPLLRADVAMHEDYRPADDRPLDLPVTALRGADDRLVSAADSAQWAAATAGAFTAHEFPGGHMYLTESATALLEFTAGAVAEGR
ncbi:thioesterase II family protein [Streptomyces xiamenensis]|uniref:Thioesterase n=1 Tax=Streptomyces xiamenensis TaxID=408015 RepID=A0A0F7G0V3_9ACTN|nr:MULTISPECIES: alpha/beta fold hydrolase [Streptomyces]AKG46648.1 thioesterase [Streptomyces xiamenensis]